MKVAILGAGFAGLSAAWHLIQKNPAEILIFDPKGIGGGASGIATGLMHPYVGEQGRRSLLATEGMHASKDLIQAVENKYGISVSTHQGIIRHVQNEEQRQMFLSHAHTYGDVKPLPDGSFWITSGVTVHCPLYLEYLWRMLAEQGAQLIHREVTDLQSLKEFDRIIIASGAGIKIFPELSALQTSLVKGQVLTCRVPESISLPTLSTISKGYLALSPKPNLCHVGSTYEREDLTDTPDVGIAKRLLFDKVETFFPAVHQLEVIDCKAALRVCRRGHYFPFAGHIKDNIWAFTGLGSRGLLYHAYVGNQLIEQIMMELSLGQQLP